MCAILFPELLEDGLDFHGRIEVEALELIGSEVDEVLNQFFQLVKLFCADIHIVFTSIVLKF